MTDQERSSSESPHSEIERDRHATGESEAGSSWSQRLDLFERRDRYESRMEWSEEAEDDDWETITSPANRHAALPDPLAPIHVSRAESGNAAAQIEDLELAVTVARRALVDRDAENSGLRSALGASHQQVRSREGEIADLTTKLAVANATNESRSRELSSLSGRQTGTVEQANALEREVQALREKLRRAAEAGEKQDRKIESLRSTRNTLEETMKARDRVIKARDDELEARGQEINALRERIAAHQKSIADRDAEIALQADQLQAHHERARNLAAEIGGREEVVSQQRRKLEERDDQLANLLATLEVVERAVSIRPGMSELAPSTGFDSAPFSPAVHGATAPEMNSELPAAAPTTSRYEPPPPLAPPIEQRNSEPAAAADGVGLDHGADEIDGTGDLDDPSATVLQTGAAGHIDDDELNGTQDFDDVADEPRDTPDETASANSDDENESEDIPDEFEEEDEAEVDGPTDAAGEEASTDGATEESAGETALAAAEEGKEKNEVENESGNRAAAATSDSASRFEEQLSELEPEGDLLMQRPASQPAIFLSWRDARIAQHFEAKEIKSYDEFLVDAIATACDDVGEEEACIWSLCGADGELELRVARSLVARGHENFIFECFEDRPAWRTARMEIAEAEGLGDYFECVPATSDSWNEDQKYDVFIADGSLAVVSDLAGTMERIQNAWKEESVLLIGASLGPSSAGKSPENAETVDRIWSVMSDRYMHNAITGESQTSFSAPEQASDAPGNGGPLSPSSENLLALLLDTYCFETFAAFGNLVNAFIGPEIGFNFDPSKASDRKFVEQFSALDEAQIDAGSIHPVHMVAALRTGSIPDAFMLENRPPERCMMSADEDS